MHDQGVGFDVSKLTSRPDSPGFGLFSVREQITLLGGSVEVAAVKPHGTAVHLQVPVKGAGGIANSAGLVEP